MKLRIVNRGCPRGVVRVEGEDGTLIEGDTEVRVHPIIGGKQVRVDITVLADIDIVAEVEK